MQTERIDRNDTEVEMGAVAMSIITTASFLKAGHDGGALAVVCRESQQRLGDAMIERLEAGNVR